MFCRYLFFKFLPLNSFSHPLEYKIYMIKNLCLNLNQNIS
ncbi:hypothetical protein Pint_12106 [Pistacia integerrima]|uniref:Uncharacterized protein n=1 Tax=Pistacia integerrima TaxID=434235 RepID=A0ACC0XLT8_9ROSI|nr:hypothetical protein Pint_12106 [Pistacia integerrima]